MNKNIKRIIKGLSKGLTFVLYCLSENWSVISKQKLQHFELYMNFSCVCVCVNRHLGMCFKYVFQMASQSVTSRCDNKQDEQITRRGHCNLHSAWRPCVHAIDRASLTVAPLVRALNHLCAVMWNTKNDGHAYKSTCTIHSYRVHQTCTFMWSLFLYIYRPYISNILGWLLHCPFLMLHVACTYTSYLITISQRGTLQSTPFR